MKRFATTLLFVHLVGGCVLPHEKVVSRTPPVPVERTFEQTRLVLEPHDGPQTLVVRVTRIDETRRERALESQETREQWLSLHTGVERFDTSGVQHTNTVRQDVEVLSREEKRSACSRGSVSLELGAQPFVTKFLAADGTVRLEHAELAPLPWERGGVLLVATAEHASGTAALPPQLERRFRAARGVELHDQALAAEGKGDLERAELAAAGARDLGHELGAVTHARVSALAAIRRGDLAGALAKLEPVKTRPAIGELHARVQARIDERTLARATAHLEAGRPARTLSILAPFAETRGDREAVDRAGDLANRAVMAWAERCNTAARTAGDADKLVLTAVSYVLESTDAGEKQVAELLEKPPSAGALVETRTLRFFSAPLARRDPGRLATDIRERLARALTHLAPTAGKARAAATTAARPKEAELEPLLAGCPACHESGLAGKGDLEPCPRCEGSGLGPR